MESQSFLKVTKNNNISEVISFLKGRLATMHPSYFALSMATGIVSIAGHLLGLDELAVVLTWINIIIFPILWILLILRIVIFPKNVIQDLSNHGRAPGFFTAVVSTSVIGTQVDLIYKWIAVAEYLWWANLLLWIICTYSIFMMLTIKKEKPSLGEGINGSWMISVVATQSVVVLGCSLNAMMFGNREVALFILMCFWLLGIMLYLWIGALIFYRYMFFTLSTNDLMPPYWINMGAAAITSLAGALLAQAVKSSILLEHFRSFILGLTIFFWATATWWIPLLLILGIWKHYSRHIPIVYDPLYWGLVFPFGMYARSTFQLARALEVPFLLWISNVSVVAAFIVWFATFMGLIGWLITTPYLARQAQDDSAINSTKSIAQMKLGKRFMTSGFVLSILGIVLYGMTNFNMTVNHVVYSSVFTGTKGMLIPTLSTIAVGTLILLFGSYIHLKGAMNGNLSKGH